MQITLAVTNGFCLMWEVSEIIHNLRERERERGNNCGIISNLFEALNGNSSILNHCPLLHQSQNYMAQLVQSNCNGKHSISRSVSSAVCGHSTRVYV